MNQYQDALRGGRPSVAIVGILTGLLSFVVFYGLIARGVIWLCWVFVGRPAGFETFLADALAYRNPWGLVGVHLGIAVLIPVSLALVAVIHRDRPQFLWSVTGRLRWGYLAACLGVAVVVINVLFLARQAFPLAVNPQTDFLLFLVVTLLTSPLQAVAEEVFFRGYLMQALGALVAGPWVAIIGSALVFASFHGTQNLPLFLDRFGFGLLAGVLVWRTGGLEAGIAAHIVNNIFAFVWAGLLSTIAEVKAVTAVGWDQAAWDLATFAIFTVLAVHLARRMRVARASG